MKCNRCNKNEATTYYKQSINGITKEYMLCPECAHEMKLDISDDFSPFKLFGNAFGFSGSTPSVALQKHCTLCNSTFDDIVRSGKVGCAECYKVFEKELRPSIRRIHGNVKYIPNQNDTVQDKDGINKGKQESETDKLKAELKIAIENEEYEKAALIRDKIKEREANNNE